MSSSVVSASELPLARPGARICLTGYIGTVKYVGQVDDTEGIWLGIEWDDPLRGKHDGTKAGKRYFDCLPLSVAGSGSFVKASAPISYGQSFLQGLFSKYVDAPHGSDGKESVTLGSSNGAIEVEAVGLDEVRSKLAKLDRLRYITLDGENVAFADPPGRIEQTCPCVGWLDLSNSLISTWDTLALIAAELPRLEVLILNHNLFVQLKSRSNLANAFTSLKELRLNKTMTIWEDAIVLISCMPQLRSLELGYNQLHLPEGTDSLVASHSSLEEINFDANDLNSWCGIMDSVASVAALHRLILTSNRISSIPQPDERRPNRHVKHLGLGSNQLDHWRDVDALYSWLPNLETLSISGNPLVDSNNNFRPLIVARIPSLRFLNSTTISERERNDCELFYLSQISQYPGTDDTRALEHPRWPDLCAKHGKPESAPAVSRDTLSERLIVINVYQSNTQPPTGPPSTVPSFRQALAPPSTLRVLRTMTYRLFRLKLQKIFGATGKQARLRVWVLMDDGGAVELDDDVAKDLDWYGIQDGSDVVVFSP